MYYPTTILWTGGRHGVINQKTEKGIPYYYVVESKRINGKPRIVEQHYLGTADKIFKTCQKKSAPVAQEVALTRIGPLALWDVACSAKLPEMIDAAFPKRDQGASLSHYLLLAAFARAFHPCSKSKIGQWYEETALKREWGCAPIYSPANTSGMPWIVLIWTDSLK